MEGTRRRPGPILRFMSDQPLQRRFLRRASVLVVLVVLVVAVLVAWRAGYRYQQGVAGECALRFEADKTRLDDDRHHWDWWPPGWVCAFEQDVRRWERHLW
jgi:hypothetical protein